MSGQCSNFHAEEGRKYSSSDPTSTSHSQTLDVSSAKHAFDNQNSRIWDINTKNKKRNFVREIEQVAQLSHTDRAAGWVIYGQKWKT